MRILFASNELPWPPDSGTRIRLASIVAGLAAMGDVDVFVALSEDRLPEVTEPPAGLGVTRFLVAGDEPRRSRIARRLQWVLGRPPYDLTYRRWARSRHELRGWAHASYDVVWFTRIETWRALRGSARGPVVVDLDDLGDRRLEHRRAVGSIDGTGRQPGRSPYPRRVRQWLDAVDIRRWRRLQRRAAASVAAVAVCSDLDRRHLDVSNVVVLPNGYEVGEPPGDAVHPAPRPDGPVLAMVGVLGYEPNQDAANWFARDVFPRIRSRCHQAVFRLVGRPHPAVGGLAALPGIELRGFVDDIGTELAQADVVVIPIRWAGGTRVKILEAFAHRVPVVTTSVGCEGLEVVDGAHVLIADDPETFAAACLRLLGDPALRDRLVTAAVDLLASEYSVARLRERAGRLARAVGGSA